ncbi:MAG: virulence factor [Bacteroidia bacterium]|nr:virulence factor [Bacteroidia bacterium]
MKKLVFVAFVFSFFLISGSAEVPSVDTVNIAPFGRVFIYKQAGTPVNVAIMISGDGGWKYGVVGFSEAFSEMNTMVIGVDILQYFNDLRKRDENCYNVASDFVNLTTVIEKKYNFHDYRPAVVMGYSSGATLVYGILAQARPGTFIGGISLGFCPDIELPKMLCQVNGLSEKTGIQGKSYFLQPDAKLGNPWIVLQGKLDKVCDYPMVADFVSKTADGELVSLPKVGHGFSKWSDFMPQWKDAYNRLIEKFDQSRSENSGDIQIQTLPLTVTNAKFQNNKAPAVLFISGDGGWYRFEQNIADNLADLGIPTIGLDSKKYFWNRRSPDETAGDVAKVLDYYSKKWERKRFILMGYSFGSEIVPFIVSRLPEDLKSKIEASVLLSPTATSDFEIHISDMLGMENRKNTYKVIDEIRKEQTGKILLIYGKDEKSAVPKQLTGTAAKIRYIPGDHHYQYNQAVIVQTMKENIAF